MNVEKLASALFFLGCDAARPFADDLFLPDPVVRTVVPAIKSALAPRLDRGFIGACDVNRDAEIAGILRELETAVGQDLVDLCWDWIDELCILGVSDRRAERNWKRLLSACERKDFLPSIKGKTLDDLSQLWRGYVASNRAAEEKLEAEFPKHPSEWDSKLKPGLYDEWTGVSDCIYVIASHNRFLVHWENRFSNAGIEQLLEIRQWGEEAAQLLDEGSTHLAFPGVWRYGRRVFHMMLKNKGLSSSLYP